MKAMTQALRDLLATGQFVRADLWTITLNGGTVIRFTGHDQTIKWAGNTFAKGPAIERGRISEKIGLEVSTLDMTITANSDDLINGTPIIGFISQHGLDGANIKLERAYAPDWSSPITGSVIRFAGKVTSVPSVQGNVAQLTVSSWLVLLNAAAPRNLYQAGCLHTLYDADCGLNAANFRQTGTVASGGAGQKVSFGSSVTNTAGYYAQGRVVFTSGPNAGQSRTIKSFDGAGNFTLVRPLPAACGSGDAFTVFAGCDLAKATCASKFNNAANFKGFPYVPVPTTSLGSRAQSTTTQGGKG